MNVMSSNKNIDQEEFNTTKRWNDSTSVITDIDGIKEAYFYDTLEFKREENVRQLKKIPQKWDGYCIESPEFNSHEYFIFPYFFCNAKENKFINCKTGQAYDNVTDFMKNRNFKIGQTHLGFFDMAKVRKISDLNGLKDLIKGLNINTITKHYNESKTTFLDLVKQLNKNDANLFVIGVPSSTKLYGEYLNIAIEEIGEKKNLSSFVSKINNDIKSADTHINKNILKNNIVIDKEKLSTHIVENSTKQGNLRVLIIDDVYLSGNSISTLLDKLRKSLKKGFEGIDFYLACPLKKILPPNNFFTDFNMGPDSKGTIINS